MSTELDELERAMFHFPTDGGSSLARSRTVGREIVVVVKPLPGDVLPDEACCQARKSGE